MTQRMRLILEADERDTLRAVKETREALRGVAKDAGAAMGEAGREIERGAQKMRQQAERGARQQNQQLQQMAQQMKFAIQSPLYAAGEAAEKFMLRFGAMGVAIVGVGVAAGAAGLGMLSLAKETGKFAEGITNLSYRVGISTTFAQELTGAAKLAGVEIGALEAAFRPLAEAMSQNSAEGKRAKQALLEIGVVAADSLGRLKGTEQIVLEIARALAGIEDAAERQRAITRVLGQGGKELVPLLLELESLIKQVRDTGVVMTEESLKNFNKFDDALDKLSLRWQALKQRLAEKAVAAIEISEKHGGPMGLMSLVSVKAPLVEGVFPPRLLGPRPPGADYARRRQEEATIAAGNRARAEFLRRTRSLEAVEMEYGGARQRREAAFAEMGTGQTLAQQERRQREYRTALAEEQRLKAELERLREAEAEPKRRAEEIKQAEREAAAYRRQAALGELEGLDKIEEKRRQMLEQAGKSSRAIFDIEAGAAAERDAYERKLVADLAKFRDNLGLEVHKAQMERFGEECEAQLEILGRIAEAERSRRQESLRLALGAADRERDLALAGLEGAQAATLEQQTGLERARIAIETRYLERKAALEKRQVDEQTAYELDQFRKKADIQLAMRQISQEQYDRAVAAIEEAGSAKKRGLDEEAAQAREILIAKGQAKEREMAVDHHRRIFESFKRQAEGVFDALLTRSQSLWSAIGNALKTALLTAIKDVVSSHVAAGLTRLVTGTRVGIAGNTAGARGWLGGLAGALGVGGAPVFAGAGGAPYPGAPNAPAYQQTGGGWMSLFGAAGSWAQRQPASAAAAPGSVYNVPGDRVPYHPSRLPTTLPGMERWNVPFPKSAFGTSTAGQAATGAGQVAGPMLVADAWRRGGGWGVAEASAGGAAFGARWGPWGALIGAIAGAAIGVARLFVKSKEEKVVEKVKAAYGVKIDKRLAKQIVDLAKASYGGNLDMAVGSEQAKDLVELYAQMTGQAFPLRDKLRPAYLTQTGGALYQAPVYEAGRALTHVSALPTLGGVSSAAIPQTGAYGANRAPLAITIQLDGPATTGLLEGTAVRVVAENPRTVADAGAAAMRANYGRREAAALQLAPNALLA